jgi:gliding motility-associated-like protein
LSSWSWDFGDGQNSADQNPENIYHAIGTYPVKLNLTNAQGNCTFIKEDAVVFTNPIPEFFISRPQACINEMLTLSNISTHATTFVWDFGGGLIQTGFHAQMKYPAAGRYPVELFAKDDFGCTVSLTRDAVITKPLAEFEASDTSSECPPLISSFKASTEDIEQWLWNFGDGHFSVVSAPEVRNTYLRPGVFDVSLIVTDANGCLDTTRVDQLVTVGGPDGTFAAMVPGSTCINQNIPFMAATINAVVHRWDFGDGTVDEYGTEMNAEHTYGSPGGYTPSLVLMDAKGCTVVAEGDVKIVVNDTTKVDFTFSPQCVFGGENFVLESAAEENDLIWEWLINDKPVGSAKDISFALDTAGEHQVKLKIVNSHGCSSEIVHPMTVHGSLTFIPNVFTPNGDGHNAFFTIKDIEKSKWDIRIFNRWGDPVYKKDNYANDWDGGGTDTGVYYYYVVNSFCIDRSYKGIISIMR